MPETPPPSGGSPDPVRPARVTGVHPYASPLGSLMAPPAPAPRGATHGGLGDLDPWPLPAPAAAPASAAPPAAAAPRAQGGVFWPWGLRGFADALEVVALALLMFVLVQGVAQNFVVDGASMEPTFHSGEMLIVNKLAYSEYDLGWVPAIGGGPWRPFGAPDSGDVIVFRYPYGAGRDFIKRIVGLPGQTVEVRGGLLYVDGAAVDEPYLRDRPEYSYGPETVPPDHVFVLGDARNNSYDSHQWGMLDQSRIIGRVELRYWPAGRAGAVGGEWTPPAASP